MPIFSQKSPWLEVIIIVIAISATTLGFLFYSNKNSIVLAPNKTTPQTEIAKTVQSKPAVTQVKTENEKFSVPPLSLPKTDDGKQEYFGNLLDQSPEIVWEQWKWLLKANNNAIYNTSAALAQILQKNPSEQVYAGIRELLNDPSLPLEQKASAVSLLAEIGTPASLDIILSAIKNPTTDTDLRQSLSEGISMFEGFQNDRFQTELSPALEAAWRDSLHDEELHWALATCIARIGAPSGVDLLMKDIQRSSHDKGWDASYDVSYEAINNYVNNPKALPVLTQWYKSNRIPNSQVNETLERLISGMKNPNK
jgi:hypothetical protein